MPDDVRGATGNAPKRSRTAPERPARAAFAAEADALLQGGRQLGKLADDFDKLGTPVLFGIVMCGIVGGLASTYIPNPVAVTFYTIAATAFGVLGGRCFSPHKRRHQALEKAREAVRFAESLPATAPETTKQEAWRAAEMAIRECYGTGRKTLETRYRVEDETAAQAQERVRIAVEKSPDVEAEANSVARDVLRAQQRIAG